MNEQTAAKPNYARAIELVISAVLRIGVVSSLAIVIFGLILSFVHHPGYLHSPSDMKQMMASGRVVPHNLRDVLRGVASFHGEAITTAGLLLLIATPVLRVTVSILGFILERDWVFVVVTTVVLAMLVLSFFLGKVE